MAAQEEMLVHHILDIRFVWHTLVAFVARNFNATKANLSKEKFNGLTVIFYGTIYPNMQKLRNVFPTI